MDRSHWTYLGQIDCFGVPAKRRDALFARGMQLIHQLGGELQIARAENLYDTDRYDIHCDLPGRPDVFYRFVTALTENLPPEHEPITLQGYDRGNLQREDLLVRRRQIKVRPYQWQAAPEHALSLETS